MKFSPKGLLSNTNFIEILKDASQSGLTGMIRAENGPVIKVIYFQKGSISFASSNEKSDRLTEVLKRAAKLTPEQVEDAQSRLKPNVSLGKTLVELGYISARDLLWGARTQVDGILHQLLFWNQGKYQILEGTLPREIIHLNLTVPPVIFDGIMKTQNRDWILQHIGSPEAIYAITADFEERSREYKLPVSTVSTKLNGRRSLHDIAQASGVDTFELCKTVVALEYLDLARPIQDEPMQMALNTPEVDQEKELDVSVEDQPAPTEVERGPDLRGVVVQPAEEAPEVQTSSSEPAAQHAEIQTQPVSQIGMDDEPQIEEATEPETPQTEPENTVLAETVQTPVEVMPLQPTEENSPVPQVVHEESQPGRDALPAGDNVPPEFQRTMPRSPDAISATRRPFNWKLLAIILLIAAVITAAVLYYFGTSNSSADPALEVPAHQTQERQPAQPVSDLETRNDVETTPATTLQADSEEQRPLDLVRTGKISQAADFWNKQLTGNRNGYSIQVVIACQDKTVLDTFESMNYSDELIVLPLLFKGKNCYRVLFGRYATRQFALAAIEELPEIFLRQTSPASVVAFSKVLS